MKVGQEIKDVNKRICPLHDYHPGAGAGWHPPCTCKKKKL